MKPENYTIRTIKRENIDKSLQQRVNNVFKLPTWKSVHIDTLGRQSNPHVPVNEINNQLACCCAINYLQITHTNKSLLSVVLWRSFECDWQTAVCSAGRIGQGGPMTNTYKYVWFLGLRGGKGGGGGYIFSYFFNYMKSEGVNKRFMVVNTE